MKQALKQMKESGREGSYPRGCMHDEEEIVKFQTADWYHTVRICGKCLEELHQRSDN